MPGTRSLVIEKRLMSACTAQPSCGTRTEHTLTQHGVVAVSLFRSFPVEMLLESLGFCGAFNPIFAVERSIDGVGL